MHTVELLEEALGAARALGYRVRQEWLDGAGGDCEIMGRKHLFLDLALSVQERLQIVLTALAREDGVSRLPLSAPLRRLLGLSRAA
ncbi:MAG TPA: hypothetical protein VNH11_28850 [Pirellulales bacterium]|nr:hypothetical protein [Pirellulales bacterium]